MHLRLSTAVIALLLSLSACKGCKKDNNGENPNLDELVLEECDNGEDDNADGLTDCEQPVCQLEDACAFTPPEPSEMAPEIDPTNLVGFADSVRFLWEGDNPVIRGLDPDFLDETSVSVVRAKIVDRDGNPVSGIVASVAGQPGLGYTFSRADGAIDLVANGGSPATIRVRSVGKLPIDRTVDAPARSFVAAEEMVLTPVSEKVTTLKNGGLAAGEAATDGDGERTARVWFPKDTVATVHLPDGQKGDVSEFGVRLTEYTVGDTGPAAMPALLPDDSAYTYAVELSLDEAEAVGALEVTFDKTGWLYLDNFLDFEVGQAVPSGYYSRDRTAWEAEANGRVLERVGGGVDIDGSGTEASKSDREAIGLSNAELDAIKDQFADGESFWRVPVNHFSPYDLNWPYTLPEGAVRPDEINVKPPIDKDPCAEAGSLIECQNQVLSKSIPLPGTGHRLVYRSDRTAGRLRAFDLPLTGDEVPDILKKIIVVVDLRGRRWVEEYEEPEPNLTYSFEWDGKDVYGRDYYGETPIIVRVAHVYEAQFAESAADTGFGVGGGANQRPARVDVPLWRQYRGAFGSFDAKATLNMGGWALDLQHAYDGGTQAFYPAGSPEQRRADVSRVIENFEIFTPPTNLPTEPAERVASVLGVFAGQDDALFIMLHPDDGDSTMVIKRHADGRLEHWAGVPYDDLMVPDACLFNNECGEGGPRTEAIILGLRWAVGPDDAIYAASGRCLRRITEETMEIIAGDCLPGEEPDGQINFPSIDYMAIGPNSEIYLSNGSRLVQAFPGEKRIELLAGCSSCETPIGEARPQDTHISIEGLAATPNGDVYFFNHGDDLVRYRRGRLDPVQYSEARSIRGATGAADGGVYWHQVIAGGVQLMRYKDGNFSTIAGIASFSDLTPEQTADAFEADGIPATEAWFAPLGAPAVGRDGSVYIPTLGDAFDDDVTEVHPIIKRVGSAFPNTLSGDEALLASPNARHLYRFAASGRLLDIRSSWNDLVLETLTYGDHGLEKVIDRDGLELTVERNGQGEMTAIAGPYGHRTEVALDANGYIAEFTYPDGSVRRAEYSDGGLLTSWYDGVGAESTYTYDVLGYLIRADDPEGGWKTLTRTRVGVILDTSTGRQVDYAADTTQSGTTVVTDAAGLVWQTTHTRAETELVEPDGTSRTTRLSADPRFGQQSKFVSWRRTQTPGGLEQISTRAKQVRLSADDPTKVSTLTETIDINGAVTTYEYDGASHTITRTSAEGRVATYGYDTMNRIASIEYGSFEPILFEYDGNGRLSRTVHGAGTVSGSYGPNGRLAALTTADGDTLYTWDEADRLLSETTPSGIVRTTGYDPAGRTTHITTEAGSRYEFAYNGYNLPTAITRPSGQTDTYSWSQNRDLASVVLANGMTYDIERDDAQRVVGWSTSAGPATVAIDEVTGQTTRSTSPDGSVGLTWDGFLNTALDVGFEGQQHNITRVFNDDFRVTSRTVAGATVDFEYDADGLVTRAGAANLTWDSSGALEQVSVSGTDIRYNWDPRGRLVSVAYSNGGPLYRADYVYDAGSRRTSLSELLDGGGSEVSYTYDADGQLTAMVRDGVTSTYSYDARGNRTELNGATATYGTSDQLLAAGTRTYTVDESGFVQGWDDAGATTTLVHDHHTLRSATTPSGTFEYGYDSLGRRIWRRVDGVLDRGWLYDEGDRPVAEVDGTGALVSRFVYATSSWVPTYMERNGETYVFVTEPSGSVRLVVNAADGQIAQRIDYDPLGRVLADSNPGFQPFGFTAGLYDPGTSLVRLGMRDYDPFVGRFVSPEPLGFSGGQLNLYAYAGNDGVNIADPHGDAWVVVAIIIVGGAALAVEAIVITRDNISRRWKKSGMMEESNRRATEMGQEYGLDRIDAENAMRHCTRTCDYAKNSGPMSTVVTVASNAYHEVPLPLPDAGGWENSEGGDTYNDRVKDEHNNKMGIVCSRLDGECLDNCERAFRAGLLATDTPLNMSVAPDTSAPSFGQSAGGL